MFEFCLLWVFGVTMVVQSELLNEVRPALNTRPVIGILAQESSSPYRKYGDSFIYSEYVDFLRTGGARVVPIKINEPLDYYVKLFRSINGALFPGGGVSLTLSGYARAGKIIFDLAVKAKEAGDTFPIWGTCLGFQLLSVLVSGNNLLTPTDAANLPLPLDLVDPAYKKSAVYGLAPPDVIQILQHENVTDNDHRYGLKPQVFADNQRLKQFFNVLSTNRGRGGKEFVSTIEGKTYPVWGVQFHPEQSYNWNPGYRWLHNSHAVQITQYFANFFVDRARESRHKFVDLETALDAMIGNYPSVYLKTYNPFSSIYVFNFTHSNNLT